MSEPPIPAARIVELTLHQFRSHRSTRITTERAVAVLTGPNGSGKTSVLEAISMLGPGRSLRGGAADDAARRPDRVGWRVSARVAGGDRERDLETSFAFADGARRRARVDGEPASRSAFAESIRLSWITPAMDRIWMDPPASRRRLLDRTTAAFFPDHAKIASAYERAMRERNHLLRDPSPDARWLDALEVRMAESGAAMSERRTKALERVRGVSDCGESLFPAPILAIVAPDGRVAVGKDSQRVTQSNNEHWREDRLRDALRAGRRRDAAAGRALEGPHRSDLAAWLRDSERPLRQASTGEQKSALIRYALDCARALADESAPTVMLLDDVAAHLDQGKREALLGELSALGIQIWMTGADPAHFAVLGACAEWYEVTKPAEDSQVERANHGRVDEDS